MQHTPSRRPRSAATSREQLNRFLVQRLTEELAQLWAREQDRSPARDRPSLAAQLEVVDDILRTLNAGCLPEPHDLVVLLFGYRGHPDCDPAWTSMV